MGSCLVKPETNPTVAPYTSPQKKKPPPRLRLYGSEYCPLTSSIRIALEYKGVPVEAVWMSSDDERGKRKQLQWINSDDEGDNYSKQSMVEANLPFLQHGNQTISGSADEILGFIEEKFPKPSLLLGGSTARNVKEWVEYVRDTFSPLIIKGLYSGDPVSQPQETVNQLSEAFGKLDAAMAKHSSKGPYFFGDQFSLVDVYLIPFLLLTRPLAFYRGCNINPACSQLVNYSTRMTSFASYAPIRMDVDLLQMSVAKSLAQCALPPLVAMTKLQHKSMLCHFERLVHTVDELIMAVKLPARTVDPVKGSIAMQIRKLSTTYAHLLEFMLEHAQMEERIIFPALEKADRGLTKSANDSHGSDLPIMNGIKEDLKAVLAQDQGSSGRLEALQIVATRLKALWAHTVEHFEDEETGLLPLLNAAGVGNKQQESVVGKCWTIMESMHGSLFPFLLSGLYPHQIHQYLSLLQQCTDYDGENNLRKMIGVLKQSDDDEYGVIWVVVKERFPALTSLSHAPCC